MRWHRGLCAFRAPPRKQSSSAALSPAPCHWLPGRDLPLRWQRTSALAGHKVSPSSVTPDGRGHGSRGRGVGVGVERVVGVGSPCPRCPRCPSPWVPARGARPGASTTC